MSEWKPIETAPKDGTMFIVYSPKSNKYKYLVASYNGDISGACGIYAVNNVAVMRATHWMHLPNPPLTKPE